MSPTLSFPPRWWNALKVMILTVQLLVVIYAQQQWRGILLLTIYCLAFMLGTVVSLLMMQPCTDLKKPGELLKSGQSFRSGELCQSGEPSKSSELCQSGESYKAGEIHKLKECQSTEFLKASDLNRSGELVRFHQTSPTTNVVEPNKELDMEKTTSVDVKHGEKGMVGEPISESPKALVNNQVDTNIGDSRVTGSKLQLDGPVALPKKKKSSSKSCHCFKCSSCSSKLSGCSCKCICWCGSSFRRFIWPGCSRNCLSWRSCDQKMGE